MASHCLQSSAGQMLHEISENVCTEENSSSLPTEVDTSFRQPEVNGAASEVGLDSGNQKNDFDVVQQTLAEICDKICMIKGSSTNSGDFSGKQRDSSLPVVAEDMMSSAKFGGTGNMVVECVMTNNDDLHGNLNMIAVESLGSEQCSNDIEAEHFQNGNQNILAEKDNKPEIGSDYCHSNVETLENCNSNNNEETTLDKDTRDEVQYSCCQHRIVNNQSPNEQNVPDEQSGKIKQTDQRQASVTNEPRQTDTVPDDLLHVLSVVQEDIKDMVLSTSATNDNQLTNGQTKETTSTDGSDSSDSSSDRSSDVSDSSDDSDSESEEDGHLARSHMAKQEKTYSSTPHRTKGELSFSDLPHVDALDLCVDESVEITPLGEVESILSEEALVIIKSFEGVPAVDTDSILFLENRLGFGKVFEIFGQVLCPHYCVRFNNEDEIKSTNIDIGQTVYFAPDTKDLTNFVFVSQLESVRGTDASWEHDHEPPDWAVEYSDDEAELHAKTEKKRAYQLKKRNQAHMQGTAEGSTITKKQRPCKPHIKKPETKPTHRQHPMHSANQQSRSSVNAPQRGQQLACSAPRQGGFVPVRPQQRPEQPGPDIRPFLRIPPPPPRGPSSLLDGQHQLFPATPMGPPLYQPNLPRLHSPSLNAPPLRNSIMPQGPPQTHFRPPSQGGAYFRPPPPNAGMFRPPLQTFPQPPRPCQQNWDGGPHNRAGPQPSMTGNVPPNGSPRNEHHRPVGQRHTMVQEPTPYIKQESPQNVGIGPQNIGSQPQMSGCHAFSKGPPMNKQPQHVSRLTCIKQEPPADVQKYLDM